MQQVFALAAIFLPLDFIKFLPLLLSLLPFLSFILKIQLKLLKSIYLLLEFLRQQSAPAHYIKQSFICILDALKLPFINLFFF